MVNDWYVIMDGYIAVAGGWARLFFVSFYVVGVVGVLNVVTSCVVEKYAEQVALSQV